MQENLECLEKYEKCKSKSGASSQDEKKFFLYWNMLEKLSQNYPKLEDFLLKIKEGFQTTIRNIVANEVKEKGMPYNCAVTDQLYSLKPAW
jgi:hypothetical protein